MSFHPNRYFAIILSAALLLITLNYIPAEAVIFDENISVAYANGSYIGEYAGAGLGGQVAFAGDVNGDGYDDILMSSPGFHTAPSGGTSVGKVYLVFGNASSNIKDMDVSNANASFIGEGQWNYAGTALDGAGDVNGDGFDDIIISAARGAGKTYVIFGRRSGWTMNQNLVYSNASFLGEGTSDQSYRGLSGVGDVNNDGYDDFAIGATWNSEGGNTAGQAYLILGRASGWSNNVSLANVNASFIGEEPSDNAGSSISGAGDVNNDGYDDIIIGAPGFDRTTSGENGKAYVIFGRSSGWSMDVDLSQANASFIGDQWNNQGKVVSDAGDVNGDGYDDFMIASNSDNGGGNQNGRVYVVFGGANLGTNVSLYNVNASLNGGYWGNHFGTAISEAGDLNNDGYDDIMITAPDSHGGASYRGTVYIYYGRSSGWSMNMSVSTSDVIFVGEVNYDNLGAYIAGGGDVNNDGRLDVLISSTRNDEGGNDAGQVYLILNEPNSPPTITTTDDTSADEDELYSVLYSATDAHTASGDLIWAFDSNADWLEFNTTTMYLNGTPDNDDVGSYWVNITVTDEHDGVDWTNFTLTVNNVNDPPEILTTDVELTDEDVLYSVQYDGFDIDPTADVFTWSLNSDADWLSIDNASRYLNGTPDNYDVGSFWVNVTLSDNQGGLDWTNFTLTVNNINDAPELIGDDILFVDEDSDYYARYDAIDVDPTNDQFTWSFTTTATWITPETWPDRIILTGTPTNDRVGSDIVNITVDDGNGGYAYREYYLQVNNTNDDPEIQNDDVLTTMEDELYSVHYSALDIDPTMDVLTWKLDTDADWLALDIVSHYLNGTPENEDVGIYWVNVTVEDGVGGSDWTNFTLEVENVNDAPVILTEPVGTIDEDVPFSIRFIADDMDPTMDVMTWSLITDAEWLSIDPVKGYLNGTPGNDEVGTYWVNITVSDGNDGYDWKNFTLEVLNLNDAPQIITDPIQTTDEDEFYSLIFEGTDIDPTMDTLTWSIETDSDWLSMDPISGELNGTPTNDDVGTFWVNVTVSDGDEGYDWLNFTLEVLNVNDPPEISTVDPIAGEEDLLFTLKYEAIDIDPTNDSLVWSLHTDADWLSIDEDTGELNGTPTNDDVGFYWVNITVMDGNGGADRTNFTLEVLNHNDAPSILTIDITTATEDELYSVMYGAVDIDPTNDVLTWALDTDATWLSFDPAASYLSGTPTNEDVGTYYVNMTVSDGNGGSDWTMFTLTVENTNDRPEWTKSFEDMEIDDETTSIQVTVSDIDTEDEIVYSIKTDPASGLVIDPEIGVITWEDPTSGTYLVNVSASDGEETIYQEFTIDFPKEDDKGLPWIPIIIVIVVILLVLILLFFLLRRKKEEEPEEPPQQAEE
jgi:hypothetical protein